jgi:hypothetical protein
MRGIKVRRVNARIRTFADMIRMLPLPSSPVRMSNAQTLPHSLRVVNTSVAISEPLPRTLPHQLPKSLQTTTKHALLGQYYTNELQPPS